MYMYTHVKNVQVTCINSPIYYIYIYMYVFQIKQEFYGSKIDCFVIQYYVFYKYMYMYIHCYLGWWKLICEGFNECLKSLIRLTTMNIGFILRINKLTNRVRLYTISHILLETGDFPSHNIQRQNTHLPLWARLWFSDKN